MRIKFSQAVILVAFCCFGWTANGQEVATEPDDTASIKAAIQSYVAAFNSKDVDKLTSHWSPDGVYTSRNTGEETVGREAMAEAFKKIFENENVPKLAVVTESIDFISPSVALERGVATVTHSESEIVETEYSVVYVKRDGAWLIDRVSEVEIIVEESHTDELKELEWLIGDWMEEGEGFRVEFSCQWTNKQNFISRKYKVYGQDDEIESSGLQIIGWDAKAKSIKSWLFDSEGGVITGTWNKRSDGWAVQSVGTLVDGSTGSFTSIFRPQDDGNFRWEKINRSVDGTILPNIEEILVERK
jgi:uncharacterized protein (TIGR02246 family)